MAVIASFTVYDGTGAPFNLQVTTDATGLRADVDEILTQGFLLEPPPEGMEPKRVRITGWVRGEANDKFKNQFMPCVYLYNAKEALQFAAATIYHERLDELPFEWRNAKVWNGNPPKRQEARQRGYMNLCDIEIETVPEVDYKTGEPRRTDNGNIKYAFSRIVGGNEGPHEGPREEPAKEPPNELDRDVEFMGDNPEPEQGNNAFALMFNDPVIEFSEEETKIITKLRELDKNSAKPLTQQNYTQLLKDLGKTTGDDWALEVLQCLLGRAVSGKERPGIRCAALVTWMGHETQGEAVQDTLRLIQSRCEHLAKQMPLFE